jgi:hypothetical protein
MAKTVRNALHSVIPVHFKNSINGMYVDVCMYAQYQHQQLMSFRGNSPKSPCKISSL